MSSKCFHGWSALVIPSSPASPECTGIAGEKLSLALRMAHNSQVFAFIFPMQGDANRSYSDDDQSSSNIEEFDKFQDSLGKSRERRD